MKTLLLIIFMAGSLMADANTEWVDKQVSAIKPPRVGVSSTAIKRVRNPFIYTRVASKSSSTAKSKPKTSTAKTVKTVARPMKLIAILNNTALIGNAWYKPNDNVQGYKIAKIGRNSVTLSKAKKEKKLFLSSENPKIKIQTK